MCTAYQIVQHVELVLQSHFFKSEKSKLAIARKAKKMPSHDTFPYLILDNQH